MYTVLTIEPNRGTTFKPFPRTEMMKTVREIVAQSTQDELRYLHVYCRLRTKVSQPTMAACREIINALEIKRSGQIIVVNDHKRTKVMELVYNDVHNVLSKINADKEAEHDPLTFSPCAGREEKEFRVVQKIISAFGCTIERSFEP